MRKRGDYIKYSARWLELTGWKRLMAAVLAFNLLNECLISQPVTGELAEILVMIAYVLITSGWSRVVRLEVKGNQRELLTT